MKTKIVFATATAVGLALAGQAYAGSNVLYLTQTDHAQTATITQTGGIGDRVGSAANPFLQQDGAGSGSNVLVINQNSTTHTEVANLSSFVGSGSGNVVMGYQSGTGNNAEIDQGGNNSTVTLQQSGGHNGPPNANWFNQTYGNLILQDWTTNGSTVTLTQTNNPGSAIGNAFSIGQGGANNHVIATQTGYNKLWVRQGTGAPDLWPWTYGDPFATTPNSLSALSNSTITVNQSVGGGEPRASNYRN